MPEPHETKKSAELEKQSKILEFFNKSKVKETKKELPQTKIVVRRLPPRLTKDAFLSQISLPPHDYFYFVRGDLSLGLQSFSRAYVNVLNATDIYEFKEKYDDYPLTDEQGREYHAVVEWAPVQRIPKKNTQPKASSPGAIDAEPKFIEFLEQIEKEKNNASNPSEYFMETESISSKEAKVTTTPLLEYIKLKHQQKIDLRNENKLRKREAEKEKRRKEDEARRSEKKRAKERERKKANDEDKSTKSEETKIDSEANNTKSKEESKSSSTDIKERKIDPNSPRPIKIEKPDFKSVRRDEKVDKREKNPRKFENVEHSSNLRDKISDSGSSKSKKEASDERKAHKYNQYERKVFTNSKLGHTRGVDTKPAATKSADDQKATEKIHETSKKEQVRSAETKSKFRYSEQRNRDRESRNQKMTTKEECKLPKEESSSIVKELCVDEKPEIFETTGEAHGRIRRQSTQETSDGSAEGDDIKPIERTKVTSSRKDPRTERRIRNKDRPSIEIYRPGMGKFSKQRLEQKKDEPDHPMDNKKDEKGDFEDKKVHSKNRGERKRNENKSEKTQKANNEGRKEGTNKKPDEAVATKEDATAISPLDTEVKEVIKTQGSCAENEGSTETFPTNEEKPETLTTREGSPETFSSNERKPETLTTREGSPETFSTDEGKPETLTTRVGSPETFSTNEGKPETLTIREGSPETFSTDEGKPETLTTREGSPETFSINEGKPETPKTREGSPETFSTNEGKPVTLTTREGSPETLSTNEEKLTTREGSTEKFTTKEGKPNEKNLGTLTTKEGNPETLAMNEGSPGPLTTVKGSSETLTTDEGCPETLTTKEGMSETLSTNEGSLERDAPVEGNPEERDKNIIKQIEEPIEVIAQVVDIAEVAAESQK